MSPSIVGEEVTDVELPMLVSLMPELENDLPLDWEELSVPCAVLTIIDLLSFSTAGYRHPYSIAPFPNCWSCAFTTASSLAYL